MNEKERMLKGMLYDPYRVQDGTWEPSRHALEAFHACGLLEKKKRMEILRSIFGALPEDANIVPPFYCDKGSQIYIGKHFYANTGLIILDEARVEIGDHVLFGPRVCIYTASHPIVPEIRQLDLETAMEVHIEDNVWVGGNVVINPGVTIHKGSVIGSGSVVTKDIPAHVIAAGNPCRVIREISKEDQEAWQKQLEAYIQDPDIVTEISGPADIH